MTSGMGSYAKTIATEKHRHRPGRLAVWVAIVLAWLPLMSGPAHAEIFDQYQVKAVFLYNLTSFITWPGHEGQRPGQPFTIAVLGRDNLGSYLDKAVAGETINGRSIVIRRCAGVSALRQQRFDLLFVSEDQLRIWPQIRAIAQDNAALTVSDVEGFAHRGGMVNLLASGRRIRIEINIDAARQNGFEISAKLLRLARIVNGGKEE